MCKRSICLFFVVLVLALAGNARAQIDPASVTNGHVYLFDNVGADVPDDSANSHTANLIGSPQVVDGLKGKALQFDGVDDGVHIPDSTMINLSTNQNRTVVAVFNCADVTKSEKQTVYEEGGTTRGLVIYVHEGLVYAGGWNLSDYTPEWTGTFLSAPITSNAWYAVAMVLKDAGPAQEDDKFEMWMDGQFIDIGPGGQLQSRSNDCAIGYTNSQTKLHDGNITGGGVYFEGIIDDVWIFDNTALTQVELSAFSGEPWPYAFGPDPADGSFLENTWGTLLWSPGAFGVTHDVYAGENFDDVDSGTADTFVGDTEPNSPWKGAVWSFTVPPRTAYLPDPADGAESVALDAELTWTPGFEAKLHTVYFGESFDDVNNAAGGPLLAEATFTPPGPLELAKTYYWRVDEFDPPTTYRGAVWSFTAEGTAADPNPAKGAVEVSPTPILKWTPANLAASHEVYFGADADAVANATKASPEHKATKALGAETYAADRLELMTTYYWRVDEVNDTNPSSPWVGNVWSFTTGDFLVVDDFESYNDIDPPDEASNRIFDKWIDGFGTLTNGALVGNDLPPYAETTIVHGGDQAMIYAYDNAGKTSEATLTLVYPRNWTEEGVTRLSLWLRGNSANAADSIFVALNDTAVVYHDDASATQLLGWNEWVIDLAAFGIDLTNVNTITIGIGTKNAPAPGGGTGTMYFDDIRLLKPAP
ncbi:MAG: hypothetical protein AMJ65_18160 [Phycisphaerae bacterium SG8_4]|nr:MAG: hypothetical protein AMJ65_18160 [Phycisphaerae bacterium SG8_4]